MFIVSTVSGNCVPPSAVEVTVYIYMYDTWCWSVCVDVCLYGMQGRSGQSSTQKYLEERNKHYKKNYASN